MSEQLTIRERLEWLAEDERRTLVVNGYVFRVNNVTKVAEVYKKQPPDWFVCAWYDLLFDESIPATKATPAPTELEKAEAELKKISDRVNSALGYREIVLFNAYIEARLRVERLRAEAGE